MPDITFIQFPLGNIPFFQISNKVAEFPHCAISAFGLCDNPRYRFYSRPCVSNTDRKADYFKTFYVINIITHISNTLKRYPQLSCLPCQHLLFVIAPLNTWKSKLLTTFADYRVDLFGNNQ